MKFLEKQVCGRMVYYPNCTVSDQFCESFRHNRNKRISLTLEQVKILSKLTKIDIERLDILKKFKL